MATREQLCVNTPQAQLRRVDTPAEMVRKLYLALRVRQGLYREQTCCGSHSAIWRAQLPCWAVAAAADGSLACHVLLGRI